MGDQVTNLIKKGNPKILKWQKLVLCSVAFVHSKVFKKAHLENLLGSPLSSLLHYQISVFCHIQNSAIFRSRYIFITLSRQILAYSERCVMLAYWEPCHIQNFAIARILAVLGLEAYSESCQTSKMESLTKLVKVCNGSSTTSHLSCPTRFWTPLYLHKC